VLASDRRLPAIAVGIVVIVFLVVSAPMLNDRFGDSHDGRNGARWGLASRALRTDGVLASRGGAIQAHDNGTYANHPPLIIFETAAAETVAGEHEWSTRAPSWLGSIAAIALLAALLLALGCSPIATAVGTLVAGGSAMFMIYGSMLDTPVISLPIGLALLLAMQHARRGTQVPWWLFAGLAAACVLAGWQSALLAGIVAALDLRTFARARVPTAVQTGFVIGLVLLAGWMIWAHGFTSSLLEQLGQRSGITTRATAEPVSFPDLFSSQAEYLGDLFGVGVVLLLPAFVAAAAMRSLRPIGPILVAVTLAYPLILWEGAARHSYWNYWWIAPLAIGVAALCDRALALAENRRVAAGGIALLLLVVVVPNVVQSVRLDREDEAGHVIAGAHLRQRQAVGIAGPGITTPATWVSYYSGLPLADFRTGPRLDELVSEQPDALVIVGCGAPSLPTEAAEACGSERFQLFRADRLVDRS